MYYISSYFDECQINGNYFLIALYGIFFYSFTGKPLKFDPQFRGPVSKRSVFKWCHFTFKTLPFACGILLAKECALSTGKLSTRLA